MEKWQREHIRVNLPELIEDTKCDQPLFSRLLSRNLLSQNDIEQLNANPTSSGRAMELYFTVQKITNAYQMLIDALEATKQFSPANILRRGYDGQRQGESRSSTGTLSVPTINFIPASPPVLQPSPLARGNPLHDDSAAGEDQIDFRDNITKLEVIVKRPATKMAFPDDSYRLREEFKGFALVLNITEFENMKQNRAGAVRDSEYMIQLWTQLGYQVTPVQGFVSRDDFRQILNDFRNQFTSGSEAQSCVVFLGSHGTFNKIQSSDHEEIDLYRDVIYKFNSSECPQLRKKPKMFFIQACQRFQTDAVPERREVDAMLKTPIDDAIICFSTIPGTLSNRDVYLGTWFTYCLAKVFMEEAHRMDLLKLVKVLQDAMRRIDADAPEGQLSTYLDLGIKTVYFNMHP